MVQKVFRYVEQYQMLEPQDAVVAGVSGGADSVCLLFLLKKIQSKIPFRLFVVHVNHGIRKEAGEDEAYVQKLCEKWQIPFFSVRENVAVLAKNQGISEEEAGRKPSLSGSREKPKSQWPIIRMTGQKQCFLICFVAQEFKDYVPFHRCVDESSARFYVWKEKKLRQFLKKSRYPIA